MQNFTLWHGKKTSKVLKNKKIDLVFHLAAFKDVNESIKEPDKYYNNKSTIKAESAKIESKNWQLNNVSIINDNGKREDLKSYVHNSSFDGEIISNLFSNLNSLNIIELHVFLIFWNLPLIWSSSIVKLRFMSTFLSKEFSLAF